MYVLEDGWMDESMDVCVGEWLNVWVLACMVVIGLQLL